MGTTHNTLPDYGTYAPSCSAYMPMKGSPSTTTFRAERATVEARQFRGIPQQTNSALYYHEGSPSTKTIRADQATHENTTIPRDSRNNPSRHCEARQAPQQRTLFRGTGNRGHVADGLNHYRAMASTMFNRQKCTSGCLETCPFVLQPCPLEQHLAPHPSVQNGSHEKPRHVRGMPTTTHLGTVRPGRTSTDTHFRGTRRLQRRC
ncbi:hypothetical protein Lal_00049263 [Lupinus albus]|nr:hypothetical protein Lal_00049263 [Lupinus albus]